MFSTLLTLGTTVKSSVSSNLQVYAQEILPEICDNLIDDDNNGLIDYEESCIPPPATTEGQEAAAGGDGADSVIPDGGVPPETTETTPTPETEVTAGQAEICDDSVDNNDNGLIDYEESCIPATTVEEGAVEGQGAVPPETTETTETTPTPETEVTAGQAEICDDSVDNNDNGLIDYEESCIPATTVEEGAVEGQGNGTTVIPEEVVQTPTPTPTEIEFVIVCGDATPTNADGTCTDGSEPLTVSTEELVCDDGSHPDANIICTDSSQPKFALPSPSPTSEVESTPTPTQPPTTTPTQAQPAAPTARHQLLQQHQQHLQHRLPVLVVPHLLR